MAVFCPSETEVTEKGTFEWQETLYDTKAYIVCPFGGDSVVMAARKVDRGHAYRKCVNSGNETFYWASSDLSECREEKSEKAAHLAGELQTMTSDPANMSADQLDSVTENLENIVGLALEDPEVKTIEHQQLSRICGRSNNINTTTKH